MVGILPIGAVEGMAATASTQLVQTMATTPNLSFTQLLTSGLQGVDTKVAKADAMVQAYAEGQSIPIHQVTLALEEARIAVELATQVRGRLIETYREFMTMQV